MASDAGSEYCFMCKRIELLDFIKLFITIYY